MVIGQMTLQKLQILHYNFDFTTAQIVINCTLKYALVYSRILLLLKLSSLIQFCKKPSCQFVAENYNCIMEKLLFYFCHRHCVTCCGLSACQINEDIFIYLFIYFSHFRNEDDRVLWLSGRALRRLHNGGGAPPVQKIAARRGRRTSPKSHRPTCF